MILWSYWLCPGKVLPEPGHRVTDTHPVWASRTSTHGLIPWLFCHFPCFSTQNLTLHTNVQTDTQLLWYYFALPPCRGLLFSSDAWWFLSPINSTHSLPSTKITGSTANLTHLQKWYTWISTTFLKARFLHHKVTSYWWSSGFYGQNPFNLCNYNIEFYTNMEHIQYTMNILNIFNLCIYRIYTLYVDCILHNYIYIEFIISLPVYSTYT